MCSVPEIHAGAEAMLARLGQVAAARGIAVRYTALRDGAYGISKGGAVEIATGHTTGQQAKTLAHELAHEAMHRAEDERVDGNVKRDVRELEAEAVAYVVCRRFGLDVELRAARYIALWGGDAQALAESLTRIGKTARDLIEEVEGGESSGARAAAA